MPVSLPTLDRQHDVSHSDSPESCGQYPERMELYNICWVQSRKRAAASLDRSTCTDWQGSRVLRGLRGCDDS